MTLLALGALGKSILWEYLIVVIAVAAIFLVMPILFHLFPPRSQGIDGIGDAFAVAILGRIVMIILAFFLLLINPIRVLVKRWSEITAVSSVPGRIGYIVLILLPVLIALFFIFQVQISNWSFRRKYETGKGGYSKDPSEFRPVSEFYAELAKRGLTPTDEDRELQCRLNRPYGHRLTSGSLRYYYYPEAEFMAFEKEEFNDSATYNEFIPADSEKRAPVYIYNSILTKPSKDEDLRYAPIARYDDHTTIGPGRYPYSDDFYVEIKILFVDGAIYAPVGCSACWTVQRYEPFGEKMRGNRPYRVLLSESDKIVTYFKGKFYPDAGINDNGSRFEMSPNTAPGFLCDKYPVVNVGRLDRDAINRFAKELQDGVLKDVIEEHYRKQEEKARKAEEEEQKPEAKEEEE